MSERWTLKNVDQRTINGVDTGAVFQRERLGDLTVKELRALSKKHIEKAYRGDFWSFQIVSAVASRLVFVRGPVRA